MEGDRSSFERLSKCELSDKAVYELTRCIGEHVVAASVEYRYNIDVILYLRCV